jgi:Domain of unknown function (DUF4382)
MEINRFLSAFIILALVAVLGVLAYRTVELAFPGRAPPGQTLPGQTLPGQTLPGQALQTGTLKLYLSDAPLDAENVAGVYITINEIQYHLDGQWVTCEGFAGNQTYDLLELSGGNLALLGNFTLPAGNYTQIRFMLNITEKGSPEANPGCYIEFADNSTEPLFAPSGGQTGYKAIGHFEVTANGTAEVIADFDVRKAVVVAGSSYILKPTVKLIVIVNY